MANLNDLVYDGVLPMVDGCPESAAVLAYNRAARKLFTHALCWREDQSDVTVADQSDYTLTPGTDLEVFDANWCKVGDDKLTKASALQVKRKLDGVTTTRPDYFRIGAPNVLVLANAPVDAGAAIEIEGVLRPTRAATVLDDEWVSKVGDVIEIGALSYLMAMPNKPWFSASGSNTRADLFQQEIDKLRSLGVDGLMTGVKRNVKYGGL